MHGTIRSFNTNISRKSTVSRLISNQLIPTAASDPTEKLIISVRYILTGLPNSCVAENDHLIRFIVVVIHLPEDCLKRRHVLHLARLHYQI